MRLRFAGRASTDLERLHRFIAGKNPAAAGQMRRRLLTSIRVLLDQPAAGQALDDHPIREWISGDYVIHYRARDNELLVLRIWHGREDR